MKSQAPGTGPMPPFHVYRDFLAPEDHAAVIAWALDHETAFKPSLLVGEVHDASRRSSLSLPRSVVAPWQEMIRTGVEALKPALFANTGVQPFDISLIELEMVAYNDGAHFSVHIDTITGALRRETGDRLLSCVYYFHAEPKGFSGGALRLRRFGSYGVGGDFVDVPPDQNSFLVFPSWAIHEVTRISCPSGRFADSRFAINCWLCRTSAEAS